MVYQSGRLPSSGAPTVCVMRRPPCSPESETATLGCTTAGANPRHATRAALLAMDEPEADCPALLEALVPFTAGISVLVARSADGATGSCASCGKPTRMAFSI